jgi:hypothetical protein
MSAHPAPKSSWTFCYFERDLRIEEAAPAPPQREQPNALVILLSALMEVFVLWWAQYGWRKGARR